MAPSASPSLKQLPALAWLALPLAELSPSLAVWTPPTLRQFDPCVSSPAAPSGSRKAMPARTSRLASFVPLASPVATETSSERFVASTEASPAETTPATCPATPSPDDAEPDWSAAESASPEFEQLLLVVDVAVESSSADASRLLWQGSLTSCADEVLTNPKSPVNARAPMRSSLTIALFFMCCTSSRQGDPPSAVHKCLADARAIYKSLVRKKIVTLAAYEDS